MSEPKLISPLLDNFVMGEPMSDHHGVRCCPAMIKDSDKRYIVKIISIPASQVQLDALLLAGAYSNQASALSYFKELATGVATEAEVLKKLSRFEGFVPYEDLQIVPMDGKVGYDVYLLSPYKRSLERFMKKKTMTHLNAVNLGLDLCASMVMCRRAGYLYVDLKPGNIFINDKQEFQVGDLGFVKLDSLKYASLPDKYRSAYTAPEVTDAMSTLNETIDTYAIGMILYQVYHDGKLPDPGETLSPPAYADYEMAEIIMKALAPNPADRWADPMQMGQALVSYMQRNSVNDVPIVPLPEPEIPVEPTAEQPQPNAEEVTEEPPAEPAQEAEASGAEDPPEPEKPTDDVADLSFMDEMVSDDTTPDAQPVEDINYEELSEDASEILSQADELIAHETPEPVVAPEPIDVPIPEPISIEEDAPETSAEAIAVDPETAAATEGETGTGDSVSAASSTDESEPTAQPEPVTGENETEEDFPTPKPKRRGWLVACILVVLILAAALAGRYYYDNIYLQTVDSLEIQGSRDTLEVLLNTDTDESLLKVLCSDSYGITRESKVTDGKAIFQDLNADTLYKITVVIDGFHELRGDISDSYSTPPQTNIVRFDAVAGTENGSVILNFTVDGKEPSSWTVTYSAEGENEHTVNFTDHLVNINGLTPDKEYTFRLSSSDDMYIVGSDTVTYTAATLVYAQNLTITGCDEDGLTVVWDAPEDHDVASWTVYCFANTENGTDGYNEYLITSDTTVTFTDLDPSLSYTVEVYAEGMTVSVRAYLPANSATITGFQSDSSDPLALTVTWEHTGIAPEEGWLVMYSVNGGEQEIIRATENSVTVYPALPGATYSFTIQAADGTFVFNNTYDVETKPVDSFSGYGVTAGDMTFRLVKAPSAGGWTHNDLADSDYTSEFAPDQQIGVVVLLSKACKESTMDIETLYVIRDEAGHVVCTSTTSATWNDMWYDYYCELNIPLIPTEPGSYTLDIYFDGMAAAQDSFTIVQG